MKLLTNIGKLGLKTNTRRWVVLLITLVFATTIPVLAQQPDVNDNIAVRGFWWFLGMVLYGMGGGFLIWAIILAGVKKVFGWDGGGRSAVTPILWGLGLLISPAILNTVVDFVNNDASSQGVYDTINIPLGGSGTP